MLHRLRLAMQAGGFDKFAGPVEVDETYVGGKDKNKHADKKPRKGRGGVGKEIVMGILERSTDYQASQVRTKHIPDTGRDTLQSEIKGNVEAGATVYTDAHRGYIGLPAEMEHLWVDHAVRYVEGQVHTNGIENFWSLFDRMYDGTYTHADPRHLQSYFDELACRFNNRRTTDAARFAIVAMAVTGKRLTWNQLTERGLRFMVAD
jgi:transposase-like protein